MLYFLFFKEDDNFGLFFSFFFHSICSQNTKAFVDLAISIFQLVRQPVEAFVESIAGSGTCRLENKFDEINNQFPVYFLSEMAHRVGAGR